MVRILVIVQQTEWSEPMEQAITNAGWAWGVAAVFAAGWMVVTAIRKGGR